jgi:HemY protein
MIRIILFLLLIALAAMGAAWVADQPGDVLVTLPGWTAHPSVPVFALLLGIVIVAAIFAWSILLALWRLPKRIKHGRRERRIARGRHAITQGLLAIGHGDSSSARAHAEVARRHAAQDPLALLLHAQSAQLDGDRAGAQRAFRAMAEREDTRLLGLRGLFVEAQRADDPVAAVMIAEEALKSAPSSTWASHAVLGFRCAKGDWSGALAILDTNLSASLIDKATYRRQRGVLLTARALELENLDRDLSRESAMEAVKLAPTLVPAAVLASKFDSEAHQIRRSMRIIEAAWLAQPHPDLADAYAHVKLGDSARQRLVRIETLAAKAPGHLESALAIARAAIDASEYARAREALAPFIAAPTQRVAMLMAEIERTEHGDSGRARAWTLRAVRALHDPVWTADGYVSSTWRPVSPVSGRLDAFVWQTPVAALPSDKNATIEPSPFEEAMLAPPAPRREPSAGVTSEAPAEAAAASSEPVPPAPQDNSPVVTPAPEPAPAVSAVVSAPAAAPAEPPQAAPLFRARQDLPKVTPSSIPAVIPILRAPDDPGIDDEGTTDEFAEQIHPTAQTGGWRGFLSRWGS